MMIRGPPQSFHMRRTPALPNLSPASRRCLALLMALLGVLVGFGHALETWTSAHGAVYFSPHGGATDAIVREVNAATQQILVQAYTCEFIPIKPLIARV